MNDEHILSSRRTAGFDRSFDLPDPRTQQQDPAVGLVWALMQKGDNVERILNISGVTELQILRMDSMTWAFTFTFLLAVVLLAVYNLHTNDQKELAAETIYAGSALGIVLAGDWITLLIFWRSHRGSWSLHQEASRLGKQVFAIF